jgi:hypothetical protein
MSIEYYECLGLDLSLPRLWVSMRLLVSIDWVKFAAVNFATDVNT